MRCGVCHEPVDRGVTVCPSCGWSPRGLEKYLEADGEYHIRAKASRLGRVLKILGMVVGSFLLLWFLIQTIKWMWNHSL